MARETGVQSRVESHQRIKKWYLMPHCLTLCIIRYGSRVKWSKPGKGVALFPTPLCRSYRKGSLRVILDYGRQLYFYFIYIYIYIYVYRHPQTDCSVVSQHFSVVRHAGHFKPGSKPAKLYMVSNCSAISTTYVSSGIMTHMY